MKLLTIRIFQLVGNFLKIVFYLHLKLFPKKRFLIPSKSYPFFRPKNDKRIPRIIWQTNFTNQVTLALYFNYLWNRFFSMTYEYRFFNDDDCIDYIKKNFDEETLNLYYSINIGAAKADLWRILVLLREGGVYLDIDSSFCWFPEFFLKKKFENLYIIMPEGSYTNYFMASNKDSEVLLNLIKKIKKNIYANTLKSVYDMTGPTILKNFINKSNSNLEDYKFVCRQGLFTKKIFQYPDGFQRYWPYAQKNNKIINK